MSSRAQPRVGEADRDRDDARNDEGRAPAAIVDQIAGEQRGARDAEVAPDAVHRDAHPGVLPFRDDDREADRVVDRREHADHEQARCRSAAAYARRPVRIEACRCRRRTRPSCLRGSICRRASRPARRTRRTRRSRGSRISAGRRSSAPTRATSASAATVAKISVNRWSRKWPTFSSRKCRRSRMEMAPWGRRYGRRAVAN